MKLTKEKLKQIVKEELAEMSAKNTAPVATKPVAKEAVANVDASGEFDIKNIMKNYYALKFGVIGAHDELGRLLADLDNKFLDNEQTKNKIQNTKNKLQNILKAIDDISPK
jgi:septal ring factor EnvC (AmiA/AmiB activator)